MTHRSPEERLSALPVSELPVVGPHARAADTPARTSRFYSAAMLGSRKVPPREWLVDGLVPLNTVTLFSGDGGVGKSLLALQLCVAVTANTNWIGNGVRSGPAIFMSAEDDGDELHRRLDTILRAESRTYDDVRGLTLRSLAGEDALLAIESQLRLIESELFRELEARAAIDHPALIVIDTLADVFPSNENDRAKARQFIGILRGLAIRRRCAVLLLGHPSLSGMASGSGSSGTTGWSNSVRSRLYMRRIKDGDFEADRDARILETMKANYGRSGRQVNLRWTDGVFAAAPCPDGLEAMEGQARCERVFLALLDEFAAQGRYVSSSPGPTYAPARFAENPKAEGCTKRAFTEAMNMLFGSGHIANKEHGKGAKARTHIARKTSPE